MSDRLDPEKACRILAQGPWISAFTTKGPSPALPKNTPIEMVHKQARALAALHIAAGHLAPDSNHYPLQVQAASRGAFYKAVSSVSIESREPAVNAMLKAYGVLRKSH